MLDYGYMALSLANLSSIPVRLYRNGKFAGLYHSSKFKPDLALLEEPSIFKSTTSVSYYMTEEFLLYGLFRVRDSDISMVLGPVPQLPVDKARSGRILLSVGEAPSRAPELLQYLRSIPSYPLRNFLQILCTFAYFLNGEKLTVGDILAGGLALPPVELPASPAPETESVTGHNTYDFEQSLLACIEYGKVEELEQLFRLPATGRAGTMAQDTIRQQKNLLIVTATLASRAAIRGGMDVETAFALSDLYIQKAELMSSYESLTGLSAQMTLDYARKVADLRCGEHSRKLIRSARQYILHHINEKITTGQLAEALGRNRTYLCSFFKEETGLSVNAYITRIKMDEAKRLLRFSKKSLRSIAEQLGFSSQSYFQNVFKKEVGVTPLEYRSANL